ncbi:hypothetical protein K1719_042824 [Acacia pycnantha]|nr:hypothetical protein K1719_042824 [Acacia pycnantha]
MSLVRMALFVIALAITVPCLEANIGELDEYLQEKANQAHQAALEAYEPDPLNVTSELNFHVHLTRGRDLREKKNRKKGCQATNPIDWCWRCDPNWEKNRFKLASCAMGFGRKATGGLGGPIYVVTDSSDNDVVNPKPGTLRQGVIQKGPLWIIFSRSMVIKLKEELLVSSDKTIDGRGANVAIRNGAGISLQFVNNVIIHNLRIRNIKPKNGGIIRDSVDHLSLRTRSDGDAIGLFGATNIWIDHISLANAEDGLIDVIMASTGVTISNCHMTRHNDVMLFGGGEVYRQDKVMQVTVAFNHFGNGLIQRMPRCRYGFFHVVNNDYTHWIMYAIGGSSAPTILSQGNRFIAPNNDVTKLITNRVGTPPPAWKDWQWQSEMDQLDNGAVFVQSGSPITSVDRSSLIPPRHGIEAPLLARYSGALACRAGKRC